MSKLTPMMQQYMEIKENYQDHILLFRLGDFYEMFFDDAINASQALEITLTARQGGNKDKVPMCGIPHHAAENYITKLITKGFKVAICEQTSDPSESKGIVKREVVRVITAGTVINPNMLNEKENNYILCIYIFDQSCGIVYSDITTGELFATDLDAKDYSSQLLNELAKVKPKEIIINENCTDDHIVSLIKQNIESYLTPISSRFFNYETSTKLIKSHFKVQALKGLGLDDKNGSINALGALLGHLSETQMHSLSHIHHLDYYHVDDNMALDKATLRNLELTETTHDQSIKGSLLGTLDLTVTAMGGRKIKNWIKQPLNKLAYIQKRLDAVDVLHKELLFRNNMRTAFKQIYDLERLAGRIAYHNANGKDLLAIKQSLSVIPDIQYDLAECQDSYLQEINSQLDSLDDVCQLISQSIEEDAPFTIKEGGVIKKGVNETLDALKENISGGQQWIANLEVTEKEKTGIKSLKVGYNKVFGYYIEVTKSYFDLVPEHYIRKQTLANCERYITPELKEVESTVLNAESKINQLEYEIFCQLRDDIQTQMHRAIKSADLLSTLDVLCAFAQASEKYNYIKPQVTNDELIEIVKGRHPVIENTITNSMFVPNDGYMNNSESSFLLITGPNMAGKSTYMRQTALIVLMAQIGCFVPAERAKIGIVDRIFTRIGASDNLSQGQSTFLVEMSELAYILNNATSNSLIILDEIGRGTSTYDGLSIAWAVVEHLCLATHKTKTLFATHYHELTALEGVLDGVKNLNVDVKEDHDTVVFLHKIIEGKANQSYGIQVAKLAGIPTTLLDSAKDKLHHLEEKGSEVKAVEEQIVSPVSSKEKQMSLFDAKEKQLADKIEKINLLDTTPMQALGILEELITEVKQRGDNNE